MSYIPWTNAYGAQQQWNSLFAPQTPAWGGQAYTDAYGAGPPVVANYSAKHPTLHPILAHDTTKLRFDVRRNPHTEILTSAFYTARNQAAKAAPTAAFRMVSRSFPWTVDVSTGGANVTCGMVWEALWRALQEPLVDSEWGMIVLDKAAKARVDAAVKKRLAADPNADARPKRIDFLGDAVLFKGLDRDPDFEKQRLLPGSQAVPETWVVKLTS